MKYNTDSEIEPYVHGQLTFYKVVKAVQWRKNRLFNSGYYKKLGTHVEENELWSIPCSIHKEQSKWI